MNKDDRRYQRTIRNIKSAFLSLLKQKPFEKININEISELADINRSTFYLHYTDKYALLDEFLDGKMEKVYAQCGVIARESDYMDIRTSMKTIFDCFYEELDFFKTLFSPENAPYFTVRFRKILAEVISKSIPPEELIGSLESEFKVQFLTSALAGTVEWWVTNNAPLSSEEISGNLFAIFRKIEWMDL